MEIKLNLRSKLFLILYIQGTYIYPTKALNCENLVSKQLQDEIKGYQGVADKIISAVNSEAFKGRTYKNLAAFVDQFGARFTGSDTLEKSIDWAIQKFKDDKLDNVQADNVTVLHWVR